MAEHFLLFDFLIESQEIKKGRGQQLVNKGDFARQWNIRQVSNMIKYDWWLVGLRLRLDGIKTYNMSSGMMPIS